ncbi:hypothetical protein ABZ840_27375 [Streptomyces sp. NPDC047117]|uniref:hypothetical protein n=1 Tax=Streptomyces sp. NPDC047117 TaxID=3155379 RepID=UPI0033DA4FD5
MNHFFDDSTLIEIAHLICGDEPPLRYRRGFELSGFFRRAHWDDVPDHDESPRHQWTVQLLRERQQHNPEDITRAVLRLANRLEYHGLPREYEATLQQLNEVLALEGLQAQQQQGRPVLVPYDETDGPRLRRVELKVSIIDVIAEPELAKAIQNRLDEAHICHEHGAYTAAIIMLGSLLEGVLVHAAQARPRTVRMPKPLGQMGLQALVELAHSQGWIEYDAKLVSNLVRHYRNLVHPLQETKTKHSPDEDTVDACWNVVNMTLNDLAATAAL